MADLKILAEKNHEYVVKMRRHFHKYPEISTQEKETSKRICEELEAMGIPYHVYPDYTVVGVLDNGKGGKTVLIREDIDALPMKEETGAEYASVYDNAMHSCGHDAHAAMLLGVAKSLNEIKDEIPGKILLGFQVAEENLKGGRTLAKYVKELGGADHSISVHVGCSENVGQMKIVSGPFASGVITYRIIIKGKGGHGSVPHTAKDPIKPACELVLKLASLPSNAIDAQDPIVFSTCSIVAGTAPNIIPNEAVIMGTVRYFNKELTQPIFDWLENISDCVCKSYGVEREMDYMFDPMIPVVNDPAATKIAQKVATEMGMEIFTEGKGMGSDDMAIVLDSFPGFYVNLGCANEEKGFGHVANHNSCFDIDEDALVYGTEFLMKSAFELLK